MGTTSIGATGGGGTISSTGVGGTGSLVLKERVKRFAPQSSQNFAVSLLSAWQLGQTIASPFLFRVSN